MHYREFLVLRRWPSCYPGKRGKVKRPLANQAINHLALTAEVTHSVYKFAEFISLCKLLCCRFPVYNTQLNIDVHVVYATLWEIFCLFLALAISVWLHSRSPLHLRACWLAAVRVEIHYMKVTTSRRRDGRSDNRFVEILSGRNSEDRCRRRHFLGDRTTCDSI